MEGTGYIYFMTETIQLSLEEQQAMQMLQMTQPMVFQKMVKEGNININDVLEWYQRFTMKLELAKAKRKQTYIDIEVKLDGAELPESKEETKSNEEIK